MAEPRIIDLSKIGQRVDRVQVKLPDGTHDMMGRDDLDPVMIALVQREIASYNDETGGPIAHAERQGTALKGIARIAIPTMPEGTEEMIPFLDLIGIMQEFVSPLSEMTKDPRIAALVEAAETELPTSE